ncbi:hypothetical protein LQU92_04195 [Kocuria sp. LUK]|uniref:hypothetical protein n=1 Tax=Kocuria sp. LUK TaxID=2897828 RepID=UPI001E32B506|nr:hypothetical protein [Kocuria sp. LUK]MCD1144443.1 hypothetical protein [Kocuria sp. LUK]
MALDQTFTSPDGTLSFRYPTGWTVTATMDEQYRDTTHKTWTLTDSDGQSVLALNVRSWIAPAGPPPLTTILPQGPIPGVLDGLGAPSQAVVAATPGQSVGVNGNLLYGIAAGTGADTTLFDLRWGNYYLLSFSGGQELGPNDQVDLEAEAEQFAASPRFRNEILPIIQSLTASPPPAPGEEDTVGGSETPTEAPEETSEATCMGAKYTYENLQGITCDEAKSIMQVVMDTGEPAGARSHVTADYECYETSYVERTEGSPDMMCWALDDEGVRGDVVLEANYL